MGRITRVLKHRWQDERSLHRALDVAARERLRERVAASERRHSGEIRLCIEAGLPLAHAWRGATPRERALAMFGELRVWDTEHNNGVLIYLLLAEHALEVVADRALHRVVPQAEWDALGAAMAAAFRDGRYEQGLAQAIDAVDALLVRHFPLAEGAPRPNELPDAPVLR